METKVEIYAVINLKNNKIYIGQTKQGYRKRFNQHLYSKNGNKALKKDIKRLGANNFECELIDIAYSRESANRKEKMWIELFKKTDSVYNCNIQGSGIDFDKKTRMKMSDSKKGAKNSFYGKRHNIHSKNRMSVWKKENYQRGKHPRAKRIKCVELNKIYDCAVSAQDELGVDARKTRQVANGEYGRKTSGGYHWEWV